MVYNVISEKLLGQHKQIVLFSDAAGGQNKNITMVHFCTYISKQLKIPIRHVFPVRCHSYNVCDRNFGLYGRLLNKKECAKVLT